MNTVKKGDDFENLCFKVISDALEKGELGIIPASCKVFQKKGYYSHDRQSDIIFDLSIEVWPPEADRFTLLYIIECKDYSSKLVPVDDVEEFYAKTVQVSGLNTKGVFITKNSFQQGAYTYAQSKQMMLIEVNENITYNIVLYKANRYNQWITESRIKDREHSDFSIFESKLQERKLKRKIDREIISTFVTNVKQNLPTIKNRGIPVLSAGNIEEIASQLTLIFDSDIIKDNRKFPLDSYKLFLQNAFDLSIIACEIFEEDGNGQKIRSSCSFVDKCIKIDRSILNTPQHGFIVAHEIGHFFLHNKLQIDQDSYNQLSDSEYNLVLGRHILQNDKNWIEWQANQFAASLIMPKESFLFRFYEAQDKVGITPGRPLYVDEQLCNQDTFHKITSELASFFQTTKTSTIYRLNGFGLINEKQSARSIGQILMDML